MLVGIEFYLVMVIQFLGWCVFVFISSGVLGHLFPPFFMLHSPGCKGLLQSSLTGSSCICEIPIVKFLGSVIAFVSAGCCLWLMV